MTHNRSILHYCDRLILTMCKNIFETLSNNTTPIFIIKMLELKKYRIFVGKDNKLQQLHIHIIEAY